MAQHSLTSVLGPAKFNLWYETIIDLVIGNPEISQGEIARRLGRSQPWISLVMNSDSFKARYAKRREEHSKRISEGVENRLHAVSTKALDRLAETLEKKDLTPQFTLDATDVLLHRLGYVNSKQSKQATEGGGGAQVGATVIQVFQPVSPATLQQAQANIRGIEAAKLAAPPVRVEEPMLRTNTPKVVEIEEAQIVNEEEEASDTPVRDDPPSAA